MKVEGTPTDMQLDRLARGVELKDGPTLPARARMLADVDIWQREPPIRHRLTVPTAWIELTISEGRNRQVRRMTAAVGLPTLRLVRVSIGDWHLGDLKPGESRREHVNSSLWRKAVPQAQKAHQGTPQPRNSRSSRHRKAQSRAKPV